MSGLSVSGNVPVSTSHTEEREVNKRSFDRLVQFITSPSSRFPFGVAFAHSNNRYQLSELLKKTQEEAENKGISCVELDLRQVAPEEFNLELLKKATASSKAEVLFIKNLDHFALVDDKEPFRSSNPLAYCSRDALSEIAPRVIFAVSSQAMTTLRRDLPYVFDSFDTSFEFKGVSDEVLNVPLYVSKKEEERLIKEQALQMKALCSHDTPSAFTVSTLERLSKIELTLNQRQQGIDHLLCAKDAASQLGMKETVKIIDGKLKALDTSEVEKL